MGSNVKKRIVVSGRAGLRRLNEAQYALQPWLRCDKILENINDQQCIGNLRQTDTLSSTPKLKGARYQNVPLSDPSLFSETNVEPVQTSVAI